MRSCSMKNIALHLMPKQSISYGYGVTLIDRDSVSKNCGIHVFSVEAYLGMTVAIQNVICKVIELNPETDYITVEVI